LKTEKQKGKTRVDPIESTRALFWKLVFEIEPKVFDKLNTSSTDEQLERWAKSFGIKGDWILEFARKYRRELQDDTKRLGHADQSYTLAKFTDYSLVNVFAVDPYASEKDDFLKRLFRSVLDVVSSDPLWRSLYENFDPIASNEIDPMINRTMTQWQELADKIYPKNVRDRYRNIERDLRRLIDRKVRKKSYRKIADIEFDRMSPGEKRLAIDKLVTRCLEKGITLRGDRDTRPLLEIDSMSPRDKKRKIKEIVSDEKSRTTDELRSAASKVVQDRLLLSVKKSVDSASKMLDPSLRSKEKKVN